MEALRLDTLKIAQPSAKRTINVIPRSLWTDGNFWNIYDKWECCVGSTSTSVKDVPKN